MQNSHLARVRPPDVQTTIPDSGVAPTLSNRCCVCGRRLKTETWARLGIGPTCAKRNPDTYNALIDRRDDVEQAVLEDERTQATGA
jgi:hypothetical protein